MYRQILTLFALLCLAIAVQAKPTFSRAHGICTTPFLLKISRSDPDAVIRYTTDGSEPTADSQLYTAIFYVRSTTIIRAGEFKADTLSSEVATVSYIFPEDVLQQPAAPEGYPTTWGKYSTISGTAPADYEMDPELTSERTYAKNITNAFSSIPILSIATDKGNLFNKNKDEQTGGIYIYTGTSDSDGRGWERPASIELIGDDECDFTVDCALKIHGGQGRVPEKNPKHSFRLTFKDEYGKKTLKAPVFGEDAVARFNSLIVRTFYNYSWIHSDGTQRKKAQYGRDLWARRMQRRMGYDTSDGRYVNVFINGLYWGLYNLSERIDDDYCKYHFGGSKSDYDVVKREDYLEAAEGTLDKWKQLMQLAAGASSLKTYKVIIGKEPLNEGEQPEVFVDIDNFIDYMLINQYGGNSDWDQHNWVALTNREDPSQGFRFICWDSEQTLYDASKNVLSTNNKDCPTYLFNNLMRSQAFKQRYMDRAYMHLEDDGGVLRPASVEALWDSLQRVISLSVYAESARWGDYRKDVHPYTSKGELYRADSHYANESRNLMENFFPQRTANLISQLKSKGWYSRVAAPAFMLNGRNLADGDTIYLTDELTFASDAYILYTTDGSYPVVWEDNAAGVETSGASLYGKENIAPRLNLGEVTLRAISKSGSSWSPAVSRRVYVLEENPDFVAAPHATTPRSKEMYNLSGQRIAKPLGKGVYIVDGELRIEE